MDCLILIDMQEGFNDPVWGARSHVGLLEKNVSRLLSAFRSRDLPVIHIRHDSLEAASPLRVGASGFSFLKDAMPIRGEEIFTKRRHGAFVGTELEKHLKWLGLREPVFAGLTTDHCVSTSARMAHDLGFNPLVVSDATATFPRKSFLGRILPAQEIHEAALASLEGEFARVVTTDFLIHHLRSTA